METTPTVEQSCREELKNYLNYAFGTDFSRETISSANFARIFWREKGQHWPLLRTLARKYLSVAPTSISSEQIFSQTNRILTDRRSMMSGKVLEMSVYCQKNRELW